MPIIRMEMGGVTIEAPLSYKDMPRAQNGARLPDIPLAEWDEMTKADRRKAQRDNEWLNKLLTTAKLAGKRYEVGAVISRQVSWGNLGE